MDQETILFLKRIAESIGVLLIWMLANIFAGIYKGYAFFTHQPSWQNIVYYILFIVTGIAVYIHIKNKWKNSDAKT
jgi:hypothetical protein